MAWTMFDDRYSGGDLKIMDVECVFIEADEATAAEVFERKFGVNPYGEACDCCGADYSIASEAPNEADRANPKTIVLSTADFTPATTSHVEGEKR